MLSFAPNREKVLDDFMRPPDSLPPLCYRLAFVYTQSSSSLPAADNLMAELLFGRAKNQKKLDPGISNFIG